MIPKEKIKWVPGLFAPGSFGTVSGVSLRYFIPLILGLLGLYAGMVGLLEGHGSVPVNLLTGELSTFFSMQFLIRIFCVPAGMTAGTLIFALTVRAYAFSGIDFESRVKNAALSFAVLGIPFLTVLFSNRISPLFMGLWESLFLYSILNGLNLLILRIKQKQPSMGAEALWEISLILIFIGFYFLGKTGIPGSDTRNFNFILMSFCFFLPTAILVSAQGMSSRSGFSFTGLLGGGYAAILVSAFGFLAFDFFRFFSFGEQIAAVLIGVFLALWILALGGYLKKSIFSMEGLNGISYFLIIPLMIICYLSPLMFSADPDALGNWGNVAHKTSTTAFWTAELFLRGAKYFSQITSPGIGWMLYNALLLKLFKYDYALIVNAKMLVYAFGIIGFYLTVYLFTNRKIVVPCLFLGLAGYMPFYYDYNNWDMWQRYLFYWPSLAACFLCLKWDGSGKNTHKIFGSFKFVVGH